MNRYFTKAKQFFNKILGFFPSNLPHGMTEFDKWSNDLIFTYDLPNNDSIKFALATMILHLEPTECDKPKRYFGRAVQKGMAAQVAHGVMQTLKDKQKAEEEAAKAAAASAKQLEAGNTSDSNVLSISK